MTETVRLVIDGKEVTAQSWRTVLEAAREVGIHIPTLCNHESLPPYGACRFCIVEVTIPGKKTRLQASCGMPVVAGMEVKTQSERVGKTRRIVAELMLARCPDSSVVRELAAQVGVTRSRFRQLASLSSTIVGKSGCIMCGMCVRLCDHVMKIGALAFEGRGIRRRTTTPFGQPTDVCLCCGACSSICPTQAIEQLRIRPRAPARPARACEWLKRLCRPRPRATPRGSGRRTTRPP